MKKINRIEYLIRLIIVIAIYLVFLFLMISLANPEGFLFLLIITYAVQIICFAFIIYYSICRLKDLGEENYLILLLFIPYINRIFVLYLLLNKEMKIKDLYKKISKKS